ncbi:hypothetical protein LXL04_026532 [Taraxacum kok-saghyz]
MSIHAFRLLGTGITPRERSPRGINDAVVYSRTPRSSRASSLPRRMRNGPQRRVFLFLLFQRLLFSYLNLHSSSMATKCDQQSSEMVDTNMEDKNEWRRRTSKEDGCILVADLYSVWAWVALQNVLAICILSIGPSKMGFHKEDASNKTSFNTSSSRLAIEKNSASFSSSFEKSRLWSFECAAMKINFCAFSIPVLD